MLSDFHKRDEEMIVTKTNEAKLYDEELKVFKEL